LTPSALPTDFCQLTMLDATLHEGRHAAAACEHFVRRLPPQRKLLVSPM
jgi:nicotinic acid phosphoribosyltransferase